MSLLQDALRKLQKQERTPRAPEGGSAPQSAPTPFLPHAVSPAGRGRRRLWLALGGVAVTLAGAATVVYIASPSKIAESPAPSRVAQPPRTAALPEAPMPAPAPKAMAAASAGVSAPAKAVVIRSGRKEAPARIRHTAPSSAAVIPAPAPAVAPKAEAAAPASVEKAPETESRSRVVARFNEGVSAQGRADWGAAEGAFSDVVSRDPSLVEGWNGLGVARNRQGKIAEAKSAFARAIALDPAYAPALLNAGLIAMQGLGRPEEATKYFERAAAADPSAPAPYVNLAIAQSRSGRLPEAEETLSAARRRFPASPDILYHLGAVYERMGDRDRTAAAWSAFLKAASGTRPELEASVRKRMGNR